MRKGPIIILAIILMVLIVAGYLIFFHRPAKLAPAAVTPPAIKQCPNERPINCPSDPNCCFSDENCLSKSIGFIKSRSYYTCCPKGYTIDNIATTNMVYCKKVCGGDTPVECVDLCCKNEPNEYCRKIEGTAGVDIRGQCYKMEEKCDSSIGDFECGGICCNKNQECKDLHDPKNPADAVAKYCTQKVNTCEGTTPDFCSYTNTITKDVVSICCLSGQCRFRPPYNEPYCYSSTVSSATAY